LIIVKLISYIFDRIYNFIINVVSGEGDRELKVFLHICLTQQKYWF